MWAWFFLVQEEELEWGLSGPSPPKVYISGLMLEGFHF